MIIALTLAATQDTLVGLGRAPRVALATVDAEQGPTITDWQVDEVRWDLAHDEGTEGSHHARIVRFLREHQVDAVLAAHAGPGMVNTLNKMGVPLLPATQSDARAALLDVLRDAGRADAHDAEN